MQRLQNFSNNLSNKLVKSADDKMKMIKRPRDFGSGRFLALQILFSLDLPNLKFLRILMDPNGFGEVIFYLVNT